MTFKNPTKALLDPKSKVNIISQVFTFQLNLKIQKTNVKVQKINNITLEIYRIVVSTFSILDKDNRKRFFKKSFLLANVKLDIILGISFLTMNNIDIDF